MRDQWKVSLVRKLNIQLAASDSSQDEPLSALQSIMGLPSFGK